jgi:hypothetical protein
MACFDPAEKGEAQASLPCMQASCAPISAPLIASLGDRRLTPAAHQLIFVQVICMNSRQIA